MDEAAKTTPVACTLTAGEYRDRLAWIADLNAAALRDYRRTGARLELTYDSAAAPRVREFVRRERQCCPFLRFALREGKDTLLLAIEAPDEAVNEAVDAADALLAPYTPPAT